MSSVYYNVAPRYSAGSPALVDEKTALRVAAEEQDAYQHTLTGIYGAEAAAEAKTKGLAGIVEERIEKSDHWLVTDLLTKRVFIRPFPQQSPTPKKVQSQRERLARRYAHRYELE